jgi:hypothetical protein
MKEKKKSEKNANTCWAILKVNQGPRIYAPSIGNMLGYQGCIVVSSLGNLPPTSSSHHLSKRVKVWPLSVLINN